MESIQFQGHNASNVDMYSRQNGSKADNFH